MMRLVRRLFGRVPSNGNGTGVSPLVQAAEDELCRVQVEKAKLQSTLDRTGNQVRDRLAGTGRSSHHVGV